MVAAKIMSAWAFEPLERRLDVMPNYGTFRTQGYTGGSGTRNGTAGTGAMASGGGGVSGPMKVRSPDAFAAELFVTGDARALVDAVEANSAIGRLATQAMARLKPTMPELRRFEIELRTDPDYPSERTVFLYAVTSAAVGDAMRCLEALEESWWSATAAENDYALNVSLRFR